MKKLSYKRINFLLTEDQRKNLPGVRKRLAGRGLVYVVPHIRTWPIREAKDPVIASLDIYFSNYAKNNRKKGGY